MICPFCNNPTTCVTDSREAAEGREVRRRRECPECSKRFTTYEIAVEVNEGASEMTLTQAKRAIAQLLEAEQTGMRLMKEKLSEARDFAKKLLDEKPQEV